MLLSGRPSSATVRLADIGGTPQGLQLTVVEATPEVFSPVYTVQAPGLTGGEPGLLGGLVGGLVGGLEPLHPVQPGF